MDGHFLILLGSDMNMMGSMWSVADVDGMSMWLYCDAVMWGLIVLWCCYVVVIWGLVGNVLSPFNALLSQENEQKYKVDIITDSEQCQS